MSIPLPVCSRFILKILVPRLSRLVFAYHARTGTWKSLEWYGRAGPRFKHLRICERPFKVHL
jgi:hypothetical protein